MSTPWAPACPLLLGPSPPAPLTRFPGSGLLKRIETSEGYSSLPPEVSGVAEHIQQLFPRLAVEPRVVRQLFQDDDEARLRTGLVHDVGHAVVQGVQVLAEMRRQQEGLRNAVEHVLLGLRP